MKMAELVIKNSKLVLPDQIFEGGLAIEDGKITEIKKDTHLPYADHVINAMGNYIIPGLIDAHVHFREPGASSKEDWLTGSSAAASGGITTVLDMPNTQPSTTTIAHLNEKREIAASKSIVDYGFHFGASADNFGELGKLEENIASVKFYMCSTVGSLVIDNDAIMFEEFRAISEKGIIATVHAENGEMVNYWTAKVKESGRSDALAHADARPNICAGDATNQAVFLARIAGNSLHICHLNTQEEVDILRAAKGTQRISAEVTPHHLFLTRDDLKHLKNYGKVNPPLRSERDQKALWSGIHDGIIDIISTDHAPHLQESKEKDVWCASSGVPGVETMLPLLLNEINRGNLTFFRLIKLTAQNPATIFGIHNKGRIEVGFDADLVIVDMNKTEKVRNDKQFTKCGWSPFDGRKLKGWPLQTFVRGNRVFDNGNIAEIRGSEVSYSRD